MIDFAAAAMMRLIGLGLRRQGITPPRPSPAPQARVPLTDKRALLDALWRTQGPIALLRIGEALPDAADEPALVALTAARDPVDLLLRWQRLERFVHSRHRVVIEPGDDPAPAQSMRLRHVSLDPQHPPTPAEDLLVLGLLAALIERLGVAGLQVRTGGWHRSGAAWSPTRSRRQPGAVSADAQSTAEWSLQWRRPAPAPARLAVPAADWSASVARHLAVDTGRAWTLTLLARELGCSPRSLQRQLAADGQSFSGLLRDARLARSARLLVDTAQPTAAIGYLCGFADQAHFTRSFKRHSAFTPVQFRRAFAATAATAADPARPMAG